MNLGKLLKAAKGVTSPDELEEALSLVGIDAKLRGVNLREAGTALQPVLTEKSTLFVMEAKMRGGVPLVALLVLPATGGD